MANPQRENGHIDLSNEIADNLMKIRIPGEERQIFDCIMRQTWGYLKLKNGKPYKDKNGLWVKKIWDKISISRFENLTGLKRRTVQRAIKGLLNKNLIDKKADSFICKYCIQKDWEKWKPSAKKRIVYNYRQKCPTTIDKKADETIDKKAEHKRKERKYTKENIQCIFSFWKEILNHPKSLLDPGRKIKIGARLKEGYTVKQCKQAILGCKASAYHMGANHNGKNGIGVKYDSIDLIFKKGDKLEQFIGYYEQEKNEESKEEVA